jgi:hypothetical protein
VIVLLFSTLCLTVIPQSVSSKTQDIKVLNYSHYIDALDILDIVGEVQNVGTATIGKAVLTAVVYDSAGTIQGNVSGYVYLSYMAPQQKSPFLLEIKCPIDYDAWYLVEVSKVELSVREANETSKHLYSDFEITVRSAGVSTSGDDAGTYWIEGFVQNIGSQTASKLAVAAIYYNSYGDIVAVGHTDYLVPHDVNPSGVVTFKVGAYDTIQFDEPENRLITSYALFVEAAAPLIEGQAPVVTAPVTGSSTVTFNPSNTLSTRNLYIVIIVIVLVVTIVLLISRKRPSPKVEIRGFHR